MFSAVRILPSSQYEFRGVLADARDVPPALRGRFTPQTISVVGDRNVCRLDLVLREEIKDATGKSRARLTLQWFAGVSI
jgi:hypothetical protein